MTRTTSASDRGRRLLAFLAASAAIAVAVAPASAFAELRSNEYVCGDLRPYGQTGPYDYRTATPELHRIVESAHFTMEVETLRKGNAGSIGSDLDYTLRAFPNNPRALLSMTRYVVRLKNERPPGMRHSGECYFERAMRFAPSDPMPPMLYANYLKELRRTEDMKPLLERAEALRGDPPTYDLDYNIGMLYYDIGQYDKSLEAAKRAYALGAPLPALEKKLKDSGRWKE